MLLNNKHLGLLSLKEATSNILCSYGVLILAALPSLTSFLLFIVYCLLLLLLLLLITFSAVKIWEDRFILYYDYILKCCSNSCEVFLFPSLSLVSTYKKCIVFNCMYVVRILALFIKIGPTLSIHLIPFANIMIKLYVL